MIYALPVTAKSIYEPKYARSAALDVSSTRSIEAVQKKDVILCIISIGHSDTQLRKRREKIRYLVIKTSPREPMRCMYQVATGASHLTVIIHKVGWVFCQLAALRRCFPFSKNFSNLWTQPMSIYLRLSTRRLEYMRAVSRNVSRWRFGPSASRNLGKYLRSTLTRRQDCSVQCRLAAGRSGMRILTMLTSDRLAAIGSISFLHIETEPTYTILVHAYFGVFLRFDDRTRLAFATFFTCGYMG